MLNKLTRIVEYVWIVFAAICLVMAIIKLTEGNADRAIFFGVFALIGLVMNRLRRRLRMKIEKSKEERENP